MDSATTILIALLLAIPAVLIYHAVYPAQTTPSSAAETSETEKKSEEQPKTIMQAARTDLAPPKDDPFTLEQLKEFDGSEPSKPIYVAIKGTIFDVSHKRETYGKGGSYNLFAGKDASKALGMSSLKEEDASPDYSGLPEAEMKVLNDWHAFFSKRYNVIGKVIDLPPAVANL
ncbi:cytochrome b5-like heme/steroid binding domain-containing protein [Cytidiella melzeri]|nr:cytochrome b5-like heme/steroid binding domain-containing protein [Cytidiella melzeri]